MIKLLKIRNTPRKPMSHLMLKFNHGVEIGARLAYLGHYKRTKDAEIYKIAMDEVEHQLILQTILLTKGTESSKLIDTAFKIIGNFVSWACQVSPLFMLNPVAKCMEIFAVFSYTYLALKYPEYRDLFRSMAKTENEHKEYLK